MYSCSIIGFIRFFFSDYSGAGDNAISCATMLEILRAISQSNHSVKHNMIFLFNGAEENMLQVKPFIFFMPFTK